MSDKDPNAETKTFMRFTLLENELDFRRMCSQ